MGAVVFVFRPSPCLNEFRVILFYFILLKYCNSFCAFFSCCESCEEYVNIGEKVDEINLVCQ